MLATAPPRTFVAILLAAACAGGEEARLRAPSAGAAPAADAPAADVDAEPVHTVFGCLIGDSAVYADLREDPATGDTVGVWITVWRAGDGIDGTSTQMVGERTEPALFTRVQLSPPDSIALDMPHAVDAPDTSRFIGRVDCARLWGRQRPSRDMPTRPVVYRRFY